MYVYILFTYGLMSLAVSQQVIILIATSTFHVKAHILSQSSKNMENNQSEISLAGPANIL